MEAFRAKIRRRGGRKPRKSRKEIPGGRLGAGSTDRFRWYPARKQRLGSIKQCPSETLGPHSDLEAISLHRPSYCPVLFRTSFRFSRNQRGRLFLLYIFAASCSFRLQFG